MKTKTLAKILTIVGGVGMLAGGLDPMEGSLLILPGSALLALGAWLGKAERRVVAFNIWVLVLVAIGFAATWGLSAVGGFGGSSGRSNWWGLLIVPMLIGWSMGLWGSGAPRWLSLLGITAGAWYLYLASIAGGVIACTCALLGVLTIGGCIYRLRSGTKAGGMTLPTGAGVAIAVIAGVLGWPQAKATTPIHDAYCKSYSTPTNINGITACGSVAYWSSNNVVQFVRLATNQVLWGQERPAGTGLHFSSAGKPEWCFLGKDWEINGHVFNGGGHDWMTCFYPNGQLESGGLANIEVIDGVPCQAAANGFWGLHHPRTYFYENGRLKSAEVAITFRYRGQLIEKGKRIELKPDGSIESGK